MLESGNDDGSVGGQWWTSLDGALLVQILMTLMTV